MSKSRGIISGEVEGRTIIYGYKLDFHRAMVPPLSLRVSRGVRRVGVCPIKAKLVGWELGNEQPHVAEEGLKF